MQQQNHLEEEENEELAKQLEDYAATVLANSVSWKARLRGWKPYAAALGSGLALATAADAGIIYSGVQDASVTADNGPGIRTSSTANAGIKMRLVGDTNFALFNYFRRDNFGDTHGGATMVGTNKNRVMINGSGGLKRLAFGATISAGKTFATGSRKLFEVEAGNGVVHSHAGTWPKSGTGFAGVRFYTATGKKTLLGWIRLEWQDTNDTPQSYPNEVTAIDWAYESDGGSIHAGDEGLTAAPEPGSLALLALGAAGVLALRKARKKAATAEAV